jgi:(R,R)-butanediol dehydrogenase/meso-butanediol dehydrogenase/diacetyl reductase
MGIPTDPLSSSHTLTKPAGGGRFQLKEDESMKSAIYHGAGDIRIEDVEEPVPGPSQVRVKVKYCGICGSDLHEYLHGPFPESPFGHEVCGEVVEIGPGVDGVRVGDRVAAFSKGGYAQYLVAPKDRLLTLPDDIDWQRAAMIEPLAGAAYAVERGGIKAQDTVLIAGAGPVGLLILLALKAVGVGTIFVTEPSNHRRAMAQKLGATRVTDPTGIKVPSQIREWTGGKGVDVSIEAVGIEGTLKDCLASTRHQGTVLVQGIFTERVPIHMLGFVTKEMTMIGANSINPERALKWIQTRGLEPEAIITSIIPLADIQNRGFEVLATDKEADVKILVEP